MNNPEHQVMELDLIPNEDSKNEKIKNVNFKLIYTSEGSLSNTTSKFNQVFFYYNSTTDSYAIFKQDRLHDLDRDATSDLRFTAKNKDIIYHEKITGKIMYVLTASNFREKYTDPLDKSATLRFLT